MQILPAHATLRTVNFRRVISAALGAARQAAESSRLSLESARQKAADDATALSEANRRLTLVEHRRDRLFEEWRAGGVTGEPDQATP